MSEIEQLKARITKANYAGIATAIINDDYEPAGQLMTRQLVESGEFVTRRDTAPFGSTGVWKIWASGFEPIL